MPRQQARKPEYAVCCTCKDTVTAPDVKTEPAQAVVTPPADAKTGTAPEPQKDAVMPATTDGKTESFAKLSPGVYSFEQSGIQFMEEEDGFSGTGSQKLQLDLKPDGTFAITTYVTIPESGIQNQAFINFRGKWKQEGDKLIQSEILAQYFNFETGSFSPWEAPDGWETEVTVKIRNITPGTFQEYDEESKTWATWSKL
ncbi:MAG: hypothetical protein R2941_06465 [Desulfobacterales bacterium]